MWAISKKNALSYAYLAWFSDSFDLISFCICFERDFFNHLVLCPLPIHRFHLRVFNTKILSYVHTLHVLHITYLTNFWSDVCILLRNWRKKSSIRSHLLKYIKNFAILFSLNLSGLYGFPGKYFEAFVYCIFLFVEQLLLFIHKNQFMYLHYIFYEDIWHKT